MSMLAIFDICIPPVFEHMFDFCWSRISPSRQAPLNQGEVLYQAGFMGHGSVWELGPAAEKVARKC